MITPPNLVITSLSILYWNFASHLILIADLHSNKLHCNMPEVFFTEQEKDFAHPIELELASDSPSSSMNNYFFNLLAILNQINAICHVPQEKSFHIYFILKNTKNPELFILLVMRSFV